MAGAVSMLEAVGGVVVQGSRDGDWTQVQIGGAQRGLLAQATSNEGFGASCTLRTGC